MECSETLSSSEAIQASGSFDCASPIDQLQAIDRALRQLFGAEDWLTARDKLFPALRRVPS